MAAAVLARSVCLSLVHCPFLWGISIRFSKTLVHNVAPFLLRDGELMTNVSVGAQLIKTTVKTVAKWTVVRHRGPFPLDTRCIRLH
jgi:hypothetical protein